MPSGPRNYGGGGSEEVREVVLVEGGRHILVHQCIVVQEDR